MADYDAQSDELDPEVKPKSARAWLSCIVDAEKAFDEWQRKADAIDKLYGNLNLLASTVRDREFQLFWANIEVIKPSIYARPPVPVVVPRFKDRRPLYCVSSELLERATVTSFDTYDIDYVMRCVRDDLTVVGRGSPWVRYETKAESDSAYERVCYEHKDRKDFLHEPARNWSEVGWVAAASYLSKKAMRKRFGKSSGTAYQKASYNVLREERDLGAADSRQKCKVWEIWSKDENKVVWVSEGVDVLLDEGEPHLKLEGFFPCPRPAYGTVQRRSLVPIPDMLFYKDQLEEINELTARIHALAGAVKVRGFYPAGAGEIGDAIEAALKSLDNTQVMVPISNWAAFGGAGAKDSIVWLPIDMIVETIAQLVELRRQVIEDVYQIMGLSDIMRGSTEASETATAQQIKAQYGSVRIREKITELVRVARDLVRIGAEIMAENFSRETLLQMSQMEIPTEAEIRAQIAEIVAEAQETLDGQIRQALATPEAQQMLQQNPDQARAMVAQAQQQLEAQVAPQIEKLEQTPTIEAVMGLLRDQHIRPFVLDIETDSTISPDEDAEKERRTEFMGAFMTATTGLGQMVAAAPESAPLAGEMLKFVLAPFRAGREMESSIDDFVDAVNKRAGQPQPNPEAMKAEAEAKAAMQQAENDKIRAEAEAQTAQVEAEAKQVENEAKRVETAEKAQALTAKQQADRDAAAARRQDMADKAALTELQRRAQAEKHRQEMEKGLLELQLLDKKIVQADVQTDNAVKTTEAGIQAKRDGTAIAAQSAAQKAKQTGAA